MSRKEESKIKQIKINNNTNWAESRYTVYSIITVYLLLAYPVYSLTFITE